MFNVSVRLDQLCSKMLEAGIIMIPETGEPVNEVMPRLISPTIGLQRHKQLSIDLCF